MLLHMRGGLISQWQSCTKCLTWTTETDSCPVSLPTLNTGIPAAEPEETVNFVSVSFQKHKQPILPS